MEIQLEKLITQMQSYLVTNKDTQSPLEINLRANSKQDFLVYTLMKVQSLDRITEKILINYNGSKIGDMSSGDSVVDSDISSFVEMLENNVLSRYGVTLTDKLSHSARIVIRAGIFKNVDEAKKNTEYCNRFFIESVETYSDKIDCIKKLYPGCDVIEELNTVFFADNTEENLLILEHKKDWFLDNYSEGSLIIREDVRDELSEDIFLLEKVDNRNNTFIFERSTSLFRKLSAELNSGKYKRLTLVINTYGKIVDCRNANKYDSICAAIALALEFCEYRIDLVSLDTAMHDDICKSLTKFYRSGHGFKLWQIDMLARLDEYMLNYISMSDKALNMTSITEYNLSSDIKPVKIQNIDMNLQFVGITYKDFLENAHSDTGLQDYSEVFYGKSVQTNMNAYIDARTTGRLLTVPEYLHGKENTDELVDFLTTFCQLYTKFLKRGNYINDTGEFLTLENICVYIDNGEEYFCHVGGKCNIIYRSISLNDWSNFCDIIKELNPLSRLSTSDLNSGMSRLNTVGAEDMVMSIESSKFLLRMRSIEEDEYSKNLQDFVGDKWEDLVAAKPLVCSNIKGVDYSYEQISAFLLYKSGISMLGKKVEVVTSDIGADSPMANTRRFIHSLCNKSSCNFRKSFLPKYATIELISCVCDQHDIYGNLRVSSTGKVILSDEYFIPTVGDLGL